MYRHTLVNSLASSASSGDSSTMLSGSRPESFAARPIPPGAPPPPRGAPGHAGRQPEQLVHRLALGDPLRAEGHFDRYAEARDHLLHERGDAGEDRGPQDEQLAP